MHIDIYLPANPPIPASLRVRHDESTGLQNRKSFVSCIAPSSFLTMTVAHIGSGGTIQLSRCLAVRILSSANPDYQGTVISVIDAISGANPA
ncbi:hypothetical protein PGT21_034609 [Puccinia graminis f. sp. tritici]|uniref:Uncharacterized protein n=1 Tax=Puccinia graminis f. sp. tritici TaxID=56615 RepID=A0A5B0MH89_PUCGR|nr:hypothetical protein PGT21_034609 [Puccinia graminis f. sp. tritici]